MSLRARVVNLESMLRLIASLVAAFCITQSTPSNGANEFQVSEDDERIVISSPTLDVVVRKKGYVTGVAAGSFFDKKSGFRDAGYGLDIVGWKWKRFTIVTPATPILKWLSKAGNSRDKSCEKRRRIN